MPKVGWNFGGSRSDSGHHGTRADSRRLGQNRDLVEGIYGVTWPSHGVPGAQKGQRTSTLHRGAKICLLNGWSVYRGCDEPIETSSHVSARFGMAPGMIWLSLSGSCCKRNRGALFIASSLPTWMENIPVFQAAVLIRFCGIWSHEDQQGPKTTTERIRSLKLGLGLVSVRWIYGIRSFASTEHRIVFVGILVWFGLMFMGMWVYPYIAGQPGLPGYARKHLQMGVNPDTQSFCPFLWLSTRYFRPHPWGDMSHPMIRPQNECVASHLSYSSKMFQTCLYRWCSKSLGVPQCQSCIWETAI